MLTTEQLRSYDEDGFLFLRQVMDPAWFETITEIHARDLAHTNPWATVNHKPGHHHFVIDYSNFSVSQGWHDLLYDSPIVDIMLEAMRSDRAWLYYDQIFFKEGAAFPTGWHQDFSYYNMGIGSDQVTGAWLSLDPVKQAYGLEMVRGSHRGPLYHGGSTKSLYAVGFEFDLGQGRMPNIEANRDDYDIVSFEYEPGDLLLVHPQLLHGGAPTEPGTRRRTLTVNVFGPEVVYHPRPPGHTPGFPGLGDALEPGEPLWHAADTYFPQLRPLPERRRPVLAEHDMDYAPEGGAV